MIKRSLYCGLGIAALVFFFPSGAAQAATNISATSSMHFAWNDIIGWMDFYNTNTITVSRTDLTGYASSSAGDISLDCHTTRSGNICGTSNYQVLNDGLGNLSGWGWNDTYGWISFWCGNGGTGCGTSSYEVLIDPDTGTFSGYAWNDIIGWISFNCSNYSGCGTSNYSVVSSWTASSTNGWLDSATFDTGVSQGVQLNSFIWRGIQPAGTTVNFQFAASNSSSGPWTYVGSGGSGTTYFTTSVDTPMALYQTSGGNGYGLFSNKRYFRYRVWLISNRAQTLFPQVDEVIVNWSP